MPLIVQNPKNRIILGVMNIGPDVSWGARITSLDEYNKILDYMQAEGYNEIDTARTYQDGKQEEFTAEAHWKDRGLKLATKIYPRPPISHKPEVLREQFELSLKALQTDSVDIFYLHAADRSTPFAETLEEVNKLHKEGKFVQFALSNFTAFEVAEIVITCKERGWVRPTMYQAMYNAITRAIEPELVTACRRYGIDVACYNPLAGGFFAGKYKPNTHPTEGRMAANNSMGALYRSRYFKDSYFDALNLIQEAIKPHDLTLIETALRWCVHHSALKVTKESGGNDGIIIGVSSIDQYKENLRDLEKGPLPEEVVKALDDAWYMVKADCPNYWHLDLNYTYDTKKALFG